MEIHRQRSVCIGYCHNGTVTQEFMDSMLGLVAEDMAGAQLIGRCISARGSLLVQNRNKLVRRFLELSDLDWLLCVDTDVQFAADTLMQLLAAAEEADAPIVAGLYFGVMPDAGVLPVWATRINGTLHRSTQIDLDRLNQIDATGMGCTLIHRSVLETLGAAQTFDEYAWFGHDLTEIEGRPVRLGEDYTFCLRARELGYTIVGHPGVRCAHVKSHSYGLADFAASDFAEAVVSAA